MLDPVETLGLLVEVSVAIAGFSGVVVVFGQRATGEWTDVERGDIITLLISAFTVLFLSLATLLLLHTGIAAEATWRIGSAAAAVTYICVVLWGARIRSTVRQDPTRPGRLASFALFAGAAFVIILNVWNASMSGQFWPFLTSQIWAFGGACFAFARLLIPQSPGTSAAS